jgi:hypothetical protein
MADSRGSFLNMSVSSRVLPWHFSQPAQPSEAWFDGTPPLLQVRIVLWLCNPLGTVADHYHRAGRVCLRPLRALWRFTCQIPPALALAEDLHTTHEELAGYPDCHWYPFGLVRHCRDLMCWFPLHDDYLSQQCLPPGNVPSSA